MICRTELKVAEASIRHRPDPAAGDPFVHGELPESSDAGPLHRGSGRPRRAGAGARLRDRDRRARWAAAPHDGRAPDYDDWITPTDGGRASTATSCSGIRVLGRAFEICSMGIRVERGIAGPQLAIRHAGTGEPVVSTTGCWPASCRRPSAAASASRVCACSSSASSTSARCSRASGRTPSATSWAARASYCCSEGIAGANAGPVCDEASRKMSLLIGFACLYEGPQQAARGIPDAGIGGDDVGLYGRLLVCSIMLNLHRGMAAECDMSWLSRRSVPATWPGSVGTRCPSGDHLVRHDGRGNAARGAKRSSGMPRSVRTAGVTRRPEVASNQPQRRAASRPRPTLSAQCALFRGSF